jgi:hypothetical protein
MNTMNDRRKILLWASAGLSGAFFTSASLAQDAVLQDTEQEARSIDYVSDAKRVDTRKFPKFKPDQSCANCSLYAGEKGSPTGGCGIVFGKRVAAAGWCSSWEK